MRATNLSLNYSNTASATPSAATTLVTAYGMNEGSGTTLADASGNGHTGALVNGPAWVAGQATYGQALSFDGVNDAVAVANPSALNCGHQRLYPRTVGETERALGGAQRHLFSKCTPPPGSRGCKEFYFKATQPVDLRLLRHRRHRLQPDRRYELAPYRRDVHGHDEPRSTSMSMARWPPRPRRPWKPTARATS